MSCVRNEMINIWGFAMNRFLVATLGLLGAVGLAQASVPVTHTSSGHPANIPAPAVPSAVLYDQMDNASANGTNSQDFEAANATFTNQVADDFVVPAGQVWTVTGVDAAGVYFNGPGPAASFNVYFYTNAGTLPGALVENRLAQAYTDPAGTGSPVIVLSTPVVLPAGIYWVTVQARLDFTPGGQWGWNDRTVTSNNPAAFENPGGGFACPTNTWAVKTDCIPTADPDNMFRLNGTSAAAGFPPDENFDTVAIPALPSGWVSASIGSGLNWVTETGVSDTAPNAAFAGEYASISDMTLDTPVFTPTAGTTLSFNHSYNLETGVSIGYDGAVLEISINGGAYTDIIAAGGTIDTGGYVRAISSADGSPIGGRQAWTGGSGGFITTSVTLPAAAVGQPTQVRFRTADDNSGLAGGTPGWWVDTIHLTIPVPLVAPTITKAFSPTNVAVAASSTLTITLSNSNATAATLSADLVDTFPAGLDVAATPNLATTCTGGAGATTGTGSVTLGTGAQIPAAGSCTVSVDVSSATIAAYPNSIAIGALQTDAGNNAAAADATLTVSATGATFPPDENFDEVTAPALPGGWTTAASGGGVPWVTDATVSDTAPNSAHAPDFTSVSDMTLDSPAFTAAGLTTLTFRHQFNLENTYDGAVLEININGGGFADVITAGGTFVSGGYIGPISSAFASPIAGRQAWTGNSAGFITTVVTLPAAATGQPTVLRFRTADDNSAAATAPNGWWVDTIHLSFATLPAVAKSFTPASVVVSTDSTATITLSNPTVGAATLTADLVDTLPAGLVATAGSAATTCTGGVGASTTGATITLGASAVIPANGSCTLTATVQAAAVGSYVNTINVGDLQTSIGNNDTAASATLTTTPVLTPPVIGVTPTALSFSLQVGASGADPLNIANTGGSNLTFSISEGTSAIHQPTSYKTVSKTSRDLIAKFGPATFMQNVLARNHAVGQPVPLGSTDISQMADNSPGDQGVSCNNGTSTLANSWWRRFYFSEHPGVGASTNVSSVTISSGSTGPTGVPVTINLYTIPHGTPIDTIATASLTPIGSGTGTIDSGLVSVTIPVSGAVADTVGTDLVVEYHVDAIPSGAFFPGANATTETHPTFLSATDCGISEPATAASIGFPDFHLTMIVGLGGTPPPTCANQADIPWLSEAPPSGTVAAGANTDVTVTANATGLVAGNYTANVCVGSNDPVNPLVTVPVTLTVTPAPFVACSGGTDEIFCDGFEGSAGGGAGTYTDRTTFLTHVAAGYFDNPFADAVPGPITSLSYTNGGWAYTVTASTDQLYNDTGLISTNQAADSIVVTFTGDPVTAVGGNFWATDVSVVPTGTDVTILLSDATTLTFTSTGPTDFRGFTTAAPITSITIDALDGPNPAWPTMDNLIIGTGN